MNTGCDARPDDPGTRRPASGKYLWKIPLGNYPELAAKGMANTGTENYGGPILTAGGVLFIGAALFDRKPHTFDPKTGELLWKGDLPFAGNATPSTYMIDGKQHAVIASRWLAQSEGPAGSLLRCVCAPIKEDRGKHVFTELHSHM